MPNLKRQNIARLTQPPKSSDLAFWDQQSDGLCKKPEPVIIGSVSGLQKRVDYPQSLSSLARRLSVHESIIPKYGSQQIISGNNTGNIAICSNYRQITQIM